MITLTPELACQRLRDNLPRIVGLDPECVTQECLYRYPDNRVCVIGAMLSPQDLDYLGEQRNDGSGFLMGEQINELIRRRHVKLAAGTEHDPDRDEDFSIDLVRLQKLHDSLVLPRVDCRAPSPELRATLQGRIDAFLARWSPT